MIAATVATGHRAAMVLQAIVVRAATLATAHRAATVHQRAPIDPPAIVRLRRDLVANVRAAARVPIVARVPSAAPVPTSPPRRSYRSGRSRSD
jgi:hypothetical protein